MKKCSRIVVKGKVQSDLYRAFVQKEASKLEIEGTVQNSKDGSVVINACGKTEKFDDFIDALYQGPPKTSIEEIQEEPLGPNKNFRGVFRIIG